MSKLDDNNRYTLFILENGSLIIFKNSTAIYNRQNVGFNLTNVIKIEIKDSKIYFARNS